MSKTTKRTEKNMKSLLLVGVFAVIAMETNLAKAGANCHCRTSVGERVQVGNVTCIKTNDGLKEARCEFVLNNTAWKLTGKLCPLTHFNSQEKERRISTALVDFKTSN